MNKRSSRAEPKLERADRHTARPHMPSLIPIVPIKELSSTDMRDVLVKMICNANDVSVKTYFNKITKKHIHSSCAVQAAPKAKWRPRSTSEALTIIKLLRLRVGMLNSATDVNEGEPASKIMLVDINQKLLRDSGVEVDKSARIKMAAAVTSLACRVVEEAGKLREEGVMTGVLAIHGSHDKPSWSPAARGSGITLSQDAGPLLDAALDRVEERVMSVA